MAWPEIDLSGTVALVTGGTKGLGHAIVRGLARAGADVALSSRHGEEARATAAAIAAEFGHRALGLAADLRNAESAESAVIGTVAELGRIDILVNNAGVSIPKWSLDLTEEDWETVVGTNLKGAFFTAQAAARSMKETGGGVVINVSSIMGSVGEKTLAPYCAAKGGLDNLTRALALEWVRFGIRVVGIAPGYMQTEMNAAAMEDEQFMQNRLARIPARRLGSTDEMAAAVAFLASPHAGYITGSTLVMDGGWLAQ